MKEMGPEENWTCKLSVDSELTKEMCVLILRTAPCYQNVLGIEEDALDGQSFKATLALIFFKKIDFLGREDGREEKLYIRASISCLLNPLWRIKPTIQAVSLTRNPTSNTLMKGTTPKQTEPHQPE